MELAGSKAQQGAEEERKHLRVSQQSEQQVNRVLQTARTKQVVSKKWLDSDVVQEPVNLLDMALDTLQTSRRHLMDGTASAASAETDQFLNCLEKEWASKQKAKHDEDAILTRKKTASDVLSFVYGSKKRIDAGLDALEAEQIQTHKREADSIYRKLGNGDSLEKMLSGRSHSWAPSREMSQLQKDFLALQARQRSMSPDLHQQEKLRNEATHMQQMHVNHRPTHQYHPQVPMSDNTAYRFESVDISDDHACLPASPTYRTTLPANFTIHRAGSSVDVSMLRVSTPSPIQHCGRSFPSAPKHSSPDAMQTPSPDHQSLSGVPALPQLGPSRNSSIRERTPQILKHLSTSGRRSGLSAPQLEIPAPRTPCSVLHTTSALDSIPPARPTLDGSKTLVLQGYSVERESASPGSPTDIHLCKLSPINKEGLASPDGRVTPFSSPLAGDKGVYSSTDCVAAMCSPAGGKKPAQPSVHWDELQPSGSDPAAHSDSSNVNGVANNEEVITGDAHDNRVQLAHLRSSIRYSIRFREPGTSHDCMT